MPKKPRVPIFELTSAQDKAVASCPPLRQNKLRQVYSGEAGRIAALRMKCCECVGFENTVARVRECTVSACPLWRHRPYQTKE